ncbi:MAG: hypothetical protein ABGX04_00340 [Myxococcales bacterium]
MSQSIDEVHARLGVPSEGISVIGRGSLCGPQGPVTKRDSVELVQRAKLLL